MKRIKDIRIIFIVGALVVVAACGTSTPPVQPSPAANAVPAETPAPTEPPVLATPTPTPLAAPDDLPPAVQILSAEYQAAYRLLPDGEWAQKFYLATTFGDFDPVRFANASDTPPSSTAIPIQPLGPGREFNLKRVLGKEDEDTVSWVEAKVAELAPSYGDKFAKAEGTDARYAVLEEAVMAGEVRASVLEVAIFFRWQALISGMTEEMADLDEKRMLQMIGYSDMVYTLSDKDRIIWRNELRVCELLMTEIVGVLHSLDVVQNNECDLEKAVELANGAILSGKKPPTEDEYKAWFDGP